MSRLTVIIAMAGRGQRFKQAGYRPPKYEIQVHGRSLFAWSLLSLNPFIQQGAHCIFVSLAEQHAKPYIREELAKLELRSFEVLELKQMTRGQAESVLQAREAIERPEDSILIYNIDTYVEADVLKPEQVRGAGWIPCFEAPGEHWSFVRCDRQGKALEVAEKRRISSHASIGLYYFDSFTRYAEAYEAMYTHGKHDLGEFYVAPLYQQLIKEGLDVYMQPLPAQAVHCLGTPEELERFQAPSRRGLR